jgi:PAS domain S-box-containing protein
MVRVLKTGSKAAKARALKTSASTARKSAKAKRGTGSSVTPHQALSVTDLQAQLERQTTELDRAQERLTATAEILKVIASSPTDTTPVFEAIVSSAKRLLGGYSSSAFRIIDGILHLEAFTPLNPKADEALRNSFPMPMSEFPQLALVEKGQSYQYADTENAPEIQTKIARARGFRSILLTPLMHGGTNIGLVTATRAETGAFADHHVELLTTFADQAVIAIENVRLFNEAKERTRDLSEALQQQTATADVLKVISRSAFDLDTVLGTLVESAARLCEAERGILFLRKENECHVANVYGFSVELEAFARAHPIPIDGASSTARAAASGIAVQTVDLLADPCLGEVARQYQKLGGHRTNLGVPLNRDGETVGVFTLTRQVVRAFTDKQIELVQTFANQAVIAIENARLFNEVQQRTHDLSESLQQQTATADVLKIISRSSIDLDMVLNTLVETVARLCRADQAYMLRRRDESYQLLASSRLSEEAKAYFLDHPPKPGRGTVSGRVALEGRSVHIPDVLEDPEYTYTEAQKIAGFRTVLGVPLLREQKLLGIFSLNRNDADPFTAKEIELASTFADQAVIAIENARLFEELRERQAELRVTFDNMGDGVAMFGIDTHLAAWNRNLQEMLDMPDAVLTRRPSFSEFFRYLAARGEFESADLEAELRRSLEDTKREMRYERTRPDGRVIEVRRNPVPGGGFVLIYADITERKRAEQAIGAARDAAESALRELQTAQASLVHAQKMAALGQLTAGIAHEIKNPLNFVNNFAALSSELTDELNAVLKPIVLPGAVREEVKELTGTLKDNLGRVVLHGKRADSIVKNMLLHSREGSGERRPVEINAIIDESLNLAYHGARAEKRGFNITLERDFDPAAGLADIYPQEVIRVLLNLISNGFYAATQRAAAAGNGFEPKLKAVTRNLGDSVEVRIRDNGTGIPPDIQEKIFNPFFTTKPAGEGTGLGLSLSHDIVVKQHGGTIELATEPGSFTEFIVRLPRDLPE